MHRQLSKEWRPKKAPALNNTGLTPLVHELPGVAEIMIKPKIYDILVLQLH